MDIIFEETSTVNDDRNSELRATMNTDGTPISQNYKSESWGNQMQNYATHLQTQKSQTESRSESQNGDVPDHLHNQSLTVPDFGVRDSNETNPGYAKMLTSNDQILQNHKVLQLLNSDE